MVENRDKSGSRGKRTQRFYAWVQTRSLRTCTGLLSILTLAARGLSSFGEDHNTQSGRLIVSKGLSSSNFNSEAYVRNFADKDGKVWHGEGGQNLPPEAPHLVVITSDIDLLPKPPMKPAADAVPWASSPMEGFNGRVGSLMLSDDEGFEMYSYSAQTNGDYIDFGSHTHEFVVTKHSGTGNRCASCDSFLPHKLKEHALVVGACIFQVSTTHGSLIFILNVSCKFLKQMHYHYHDHHSKTLNSSFVLLIKLFH